LLTRSGRELGVELPGIAALDACELSTIIEQRAYAGSLRELWERCRAAAQAPITYLESAGVIGERAASLLRASTYRIPDHDEARRVGAPLRAAASLLPPSWVSKNGISIVEIGQGSAVLAAHELTPELARAVSRCLPTWAIEWRVAARASAARPEGRVSEPWNDHRTMN
jgi:hypothetical protein